MCVCEQRVFPFFAPMRSFIKDLSNLHTDFFSSSSALSLSLLSLSDQKTAIVEKREGKIWTKNKTQARVVRSENILLWLCVWLHKREKVIDEWEQREREREREKRGRRMIRLWMAVVRINYSLLLFFSSFFFLSFFLSFQTRIWNWWSCVRMCFQVQPVPPLQIHNECVWLSKKQKDFIY